MALRDVEYDRPRLEEGEIAFFIGGDLTERMKPTMGRFPHLIERDQSNLVRLAHFLKCPANGHIARQSLAAIGGALKSGDGGGRGLRHVRSPESDLCTRRTKQGPAFRQLRPAALRGGHGS